MEFNTNSITKLYTSLGIGYSIVNARVDINSLYNQKKISSNSSENKGWNNLNLGAACDRKINCLPNLNMTVQKLDLALKFLTQNTNIDIFKIGLSYRLKKMPITLVIVCHRHAYNL